MADCPSCGAPLKSGDWTCGRCGAPVAGAGLSASPGAAGGGDAAGASPNPYGYAPGFAPQATAAAAPSGGASRTLWLVVVLGVLAVVAIVAVWFFALRGPATTGDEFLGTWTPTSQKGIGSAAIARSDDAFSVTLTGAQPEQKVVVPAHLDGLDLVITVDDFAQMAGEASADRLRDALKALAGDFRLVFTSVDPTHLSLRIVGTSPSGDEYDDASTLVKATP